MVVFGQKWLYSGNCGCVQARLLYLGKSGYIRIKSGCNRVKVVVFG